MATKRKLLSNIIPIMKQRYVKQVSLVVRRLGGLFSKKFKAAEHDRNGQKNTATIDSGKEGRVLMLDHAAGILGLPAY